MIMIQLMNSDNTEFITIHKLKDVRFNKTDVYTLKKYKSGWGRTKCTSYKEGFFEIVLRFKKQGFHVINVA